MKEAVTRLPVPPFKTSIKNKAKSWLKRFLPAEIIGTITAVTAAYAAHYYSSNPIIAAYAGSIGETLGFYATICTYDVATKKRKLKAENKRLTFVGFMQIIKDILLDFGIAELLDSLFLRPFFMYIFPQWLHNYTIAVIAGKLASDICFYIPVILIYELRMFLGKKRL